MESVLLQKIQSTFLVVYESILHYMNSQKVKKGRGRRPKYGKKIESVSALARVLKASAQSANIFMYSKSRDILYSQTIVMSKSLRRKIKVILVYKKTALSFLFLRATLN